MSALERLVLAVEGRMNDRNRVKENPAWGEDVKVMGIRRNSSVELTVACAMIGRYLASVEEYIAEKVKVEKLGRKLSILPTRNWKVRSISRSPARRQKQAMTARSVAATASMG